MTKKLIILGSLVLVLGYQNCSNVSFENKNGVASLGLPDEQVNESGEDPGSTTGGMDPGSTTGGMDPGSTTGGMDPGSTTGGMDPGSTTGGMDPGSTTGGMDPGSTTGGMDPGSTTGGNTGSTGSPPFPEIEDLCNQPGSITETHTLSWASNKVGTPAGAPATMCQWELDSQNDYVMKQTVVMARNEEIRPLQLPPNSVLCEMSITSPTTTQQYEYDDMFLITMNGIVIGSSTKWFQGFSTWENMQVYDWTKIYDIPWPSNYQSTNYGYCVGLAENLSTCTIPKTETSGNFVMNIGSSLVQKIGTRSTDALHQFNLIVTGDDNPDVDCRHKALDLNVNVRYAIQPNTSP